MRMNEHICKYSVFNVKNEYDYHSLCLMYDVVNDIVSIPFLPLLQNIDIHDHNTRLCVNVLAQSQLWTAEILCITVQ